MRPPQRLARAGLPRGDGRRFADHPQAVAESSALAEQLNFDLAGDLGYRYPGVEDLTAQRAASPELCAAQLHDRYAGRSRCARHSARLEQELAVIEKLSLAGFFLLHYEILELSREVAAEVRGADSVRALLPPGALAVRLLGLLAAGLAT